jgi:hypothetical protein
MSVDADWSAIRDHEELHADDWEHQLTTAFLTQGWGYGLFDIIGLGSITEDNVGEVWARFSVAQTLCGQFFNHWDGEKTTPVLITKADIVRRIGLKSNYSNLTRTQWQTKKFKVLMDIVAQKGAE